MKFFLIVSIIISLFLGYFIWNKRFYKNNFKKIDLIKSFGAFLLFYFFLLFLPLGIGFFGKQQLVQIMDMFNVGEFWWILLIFMTMIIATIAQIIVRSIHLQEKEKFKEEQKQYQDYLLNVSQDILSKRDFYELQNFIIKTLVGNATINIEDFKYLGIDVEHLWIELRKKQYINDQGILLNKSLKLTTVADLESLKGFDEVKQYLFEILKNASKKKGLPITHARFFLYNDKNCEYELIQFKGKERRRQIKDKLNNSHALIAIGDLRKDLFTKEDVENDKSINPRIKQRILTKMRSLGARVFIPVYIGDNISGFIVVGSKINGDNYTQSDKTVLKIFANHVASAIENIRVYEHQKNTHLQTIYSFTNFIDAKDNYTRHHSENVKNYMSMFMDKCKGKIGHEEIIRSKEFMENAALLHDIGKIAVSDHTLKSRKNFAQIPSKKLPEVVRKKIKERNDKMFRELEMHPVQGAHMISNIEAFKDMKNVILFHHEKWDGTGYPKGLKEYEIPLESRILAVIDTYDAITTTRLYDSAKSVEHALAILRINKKIQFQSEIVDMFEEVVKKLHDVSEEEIKKVIKMEVAREQERRKRRKSNV